jgi:hypothetical protein
MKLSYRTSVVVSVIYVSSTRASVGQSHTGGSRNVWGHDGFSGLVVAHFLSM